MIKLEQDFTEIMRAAYRESGIENILPQYISIKKLYDRFFPLLEKIRKDKFKKGIDFGCGVSAAVVLGQLMDLDIIGIDIDEEFTVYPLSKGDYSYLPVQKNLAEKGFKILLFDTNCIPWDFEDDEMDFVFTFYSLLYDFSYSYKDKTLIENRLREMARILKNKGCIYFYGAKMLKETGWTNDQIRNIIQYKNITLY